MKNKQKAKYGVLKNFFDICGTLVATLAIIVLILSFAIRLVTVDGQSMEPTFFDGERLVVINTYNNMPNNDDIVIVSHSDRYNHQFIKRVIATEGQTLEIDFENNEIIVDGVILNEPYIQGKTVEIDSNMKIPETVPEGYMFVMGDNREHSTDSRSRIIGLIPVENIIGIVKARVFPFDRFTLF